MARWEGFEPPTPWFVARYSIQLSYQRRSFLNRLLYTRGRIIGACSVKIPSPQADGVFLLSFLFAATPSFLSKPVVQPKAAYGAPRRHSRTCSGIQRNEVNHLDIPATPQRGWREHIGGSARESRGIKAILLVPLDSRLRRENDGVRRGCGAV